MRKSSLHLEGGGGEQIRVGKGREDIRIEENENLVEKRDEVGGRQLLSSKVECGSRNNFDGCLITAKIVVSFPAAVTRFAPFLFCKNDA